MTRRPISTSGAPAAVGPYSQAIASDDWLFCSGQLGLDPATGQLVEGGAPAEAERALVNLGAVLDAAGLSYGDVVKTTLFIRDIAEFQAINEVYARYFPDPRPARSTVVVAGLALDARFELEAIARRS